MAADLSRNDVQKARSAFDTISMGENEVDSTKLGDLLRALKLNPSLMTLEKLGAMKKNGVKKYTVDEFISIYNECKGTNNEKQGSYEEFVGALEMYDRNHDGRMMATELSTVLTSLGEKLEDSQVDSLFTDCLGKISDDGTFEYVPFLKRLCQM